MQPRPKKHDVQTTLVQLLESRAHTAGEEFGYRFLVDGEHDERRLTYGQLDRRARAIAAQLREMAAPGDRVLVALPPGLEYLSSLFGCLYAGLVATPIYPPRPNRPNPRHEAIVANCRPSVALTTPALLSDLDRLLASSPGLRSLRWLAVDEQDDAASADWHGPLVTPETLAVLQYTSGSTGDPRGVMLTHANLMHNLSLIHSAFRLREDSWAVCWLPPYHDMGLIGGLLGPLYCGGGTQWMSPATFIQRPLRWLHAISRSRAEVSGGPNFAFDLCVRKATPETCRGLDLSSWRVAFCGAEPISPDTVERFAEAFAPYGFRPEAFYPCYGLAESTLMVSGPRPLEKTRFVAVDRRQVETNRIVANGSVPQGAASKRFVACGRPLVQGSVTIVDPDSLAPCGEDQVGEIWLASPSVARGYWNRPDETTETFQARLPGDADKPYLRTGDLGFLHHGELVIAGRLKDLVIIRGRNYYPQEIEEIAGAAHRALSAGAAAAFTIEQDGRQQLVLVQELERGCRDVDCAEIAAAVRRVVNERLELDIDAFIVVKSGGVPKTSSGKIQRRECRRQLLDGELVIEYRCSPDEQEASTTSKNGSPTRDNAAPRDSADARLSEAAVTQWLLERLSRHLKVAPSEIDVHRPFAAFGIDSVTIVALSGELEDWSGRRLSPTVLYDEPTIAALARRVAQDAGNEPRQDSESDDVRPRQAPIAIVGIGCRFPGGADSPNKFWQLLRDGVDTVSLPPPDRVALLPEGARGFKAAYLSAVDCFDAELFGVAPREAASIDPQHRLLLEVAWEALENAGTPPAALAGERVGVFVGVSNSDYSRLMAHDPASVGAYLGTGGAMSMAAHRLSYHFDFHGPSMAVDTACSSSLAAVHLACQALRNGEADAALAAGVNLILSDELSRAFTSAQMLSPSSRCRTFDAGADGYVRGEGCGVVVLKRLDDALRDGDRVVAVVRGSALNQDGRSNGITAPNGNSQESLIREALANAGARPADVSLIEAHGTGTVLGDPIEMRALVRALGDGSDDAQPCLVGSVKTNIGHLEAAAGIAGLIKTALVLDHGEVPPHLHLETLNPEIELAGTRLAIPSSPTPLPRRRGNRLAGVSAFGFGGANVHVVLEEAARPATPYRDQDRPRSALALAARTPDALVDAAERHVQALAALDRGDLADYCYSVNTSQSPLPWRLAVAARTPSLMADEIKRELANLKSSTERRAGATARVGLLFTGSGAEYQGMGRQLYETLPVFRRSLERAAAASADLMDRPLLSILYSDGDDARLISEPLYNHVTQFALAAALVDTLRAWGVEPAAVLGHGLGECAAAYAAGVVDFDSASALAAERGRLLAATDRDCETAIVFAPEDAVAEAIGPRKSDVGIAAVNGPEHVVLSGRRAAVRAAVEAIKRQGFSAQTTHAARAYASPLVECAVAPMTAAARRVAANDSSIAFVSTVTGKIVNASELTADYWGRQVSATVRFAEAAVAMRSLGCDALVEVGPHPTLVGWASRLDGAAPRMSAPMLANGQEDWRTLLEAICQLHAVGVDIDWRAFDADYGRTRQTTPSYPFRRARHWINTASYLKSRASTHAVETNSAPSTPPLSAGAPSSQRSVAASDPLVDESARLAAEHPLAVSVELQSAVDRLAGRYAAAALVRLGCRWTAGESKENDHIAARLGVIPRYERLLARLFDILVEDGSLAVVDNGWRVLRDLEGARPDLLHRELAAQYPACRDELNLLARCAERLPDVMSGAEDPLEVLFPGGSTAALESLYQKSPVSQCFNSLAAAAVREAVDACRADRPVRILEIGAGTGGTTAYVLPELTGRNVEYVFSDVSPLFGALAADKFREFPFVRYETLDIERDPGEQGLAAGQFDVILAANVLHATADLRVSLANCRKLLAADGRLVLLEGTRPQRFLDLIFGLTEGWWRFGDADVRPDYPLVSRQQWSQLLGEAQFNAPRCYPPNSADRETAQSIIVADGNGTAAASSSKTAAAAPPVPRPNQQTPRSIAEPSARPSASTPSEIRVRVLAAELQQRHALLSDYVRGEVADVLGFKASEIDADQPIDNLGLDSLMAIQLKTRLERELSVSIPMVAFLQGLTVTQLVGRALEQMPDQTTDRSDEADGRDVPRQACPTTQSPPDRRPVAEAPVADSVARLEESELNALLRRLLDEETRRGG